MVRMYLRSESYLIFNKGLYFLTLAKPEQHFSRQSHSALKQLWALLPWLSKINWYIWNKLGLNVLNLLNFTFKLTRLNIYGCNVFQFTTRNCIEENFESCWCLLIYLRNSESRAGKSQLGHVVMLSFTTWRPWMHIIIPIIIMKAFIKRRVSG